MNRIRQSFRRKKEQTLPEASRPHQWQKDEEAVRGGQCSFPVKYLGCVEVDESRGMHVCEDAVKRLRNMGKKKIRAVLWVSADALRVVDESTKDLILDQTIEKVSFCAPDRNYDRAFSYICRDGTTRRWLCHSFMSIKDSGERLSHAVGCAFAACLERKQKREKECGVTATFDNGRTSFVRDGSFRVLSATDQAQREETLRQLEEQKRAGLTNAMPAARGSNLPLGKENVVEQHQMEDEPQQRQQGDDPAASTVDNAGLPGHAIPRRHAPIDELVRQGSFRGFPALLQKSSPFKRNLSVRLNELPSTLQRRTDFHLLNKVPEVETPGRTQDQVNNGDGEMPGDSINALCSQISMAFSPEDPFLGVPMSRPAFEPTDLRNDVATPFTDSGAASRGVLHTGHRRTQSEAERWLDQVSKSTQGPVPFHSASTSPNAVFLPHPPRFSYQQASVVTTGAQNGMTQAAPAVSSAIGPPASHAAARPFSTAAPKATRNVQLSALSLPFAGGRKGATPLANGTPSTSDAKFEAQWASLENRHRHAIAPPSPRATPSPTNPFCSDVQKTFEIRI
uniref:protein numb homolog isoform X1 n=1 Tax=Myxine glutinosa TaxID=7769 RepID=UPI00358EA1BC